MSFEMRKMKSIYFRVEVGKREVKSGINLSGKGKSKK